MIDFLRRESGPIPGAGLIERYAPCRCLSLNSKLMQVTRRTDGRYQVVIPAKEDRSGRRQTKYFRTRREADDFVAYWKKEIQEYGRLGAVTPEEHYWFNVACKKYGNAEAFLKAILDMEADPNFETFLENYKKGSNPATANTQRTMKNNHAYLEP